MALSNADRQRAWRERHKGQPRGNAVLMARLAELEATASNPPPAVATPTQRLKAEIAALKQERDALALQLAQIKAYAPKVPDEARQWSETN